jgi:orotate phosphoribosyltransferase
MSNSSSVIEKIIFELHQIGAVKFGKFTLKNGASSPIYIDLRQIISYPHLLRNVTEIMWEKIRAAKFDIICGIPYTALPIATCMSLAHDIPMVMRRKEKKNYGTKQTIEGKFTANQTCLLIEDVITSGTSVLETADDLEAAGLIIQDIVVFIDREQGGKDNLEKRNYTVHSALTLTEILRILSNSTVINANERELINSLLHEPIAS